MKATLTRGTGGKAGTRGNVCFLWAAPAQQLACHSQSLTVSQPEGQSPAPMANSNQDSITTEGPT